MGPDHASYTGVERTTFALVRETPICYAHIISLSVLLLVSIVDGGSSETDRLDLTAKGQTGFYTLHSFVRLSLCALI